MNPNNQSTQEPTAPIQSTQPIQPTQPINAPMQPNIPAKQQANLEKQKRAEQKSKVDKTTTQKSLLFSEIRDDILIMADGSFRAVIECDSINFDLMSSRERTAIEFSYQNFLNSLNFDIQILVRSQKIDISPYLDKIVAMRRNQDNMLLGVLMDDYIQFIDDLSINANIMDKQFYIVVPYSPTGDMNKIVEKSRGFFGSFIGQAKPTVTTISSEVYEKARSEIKDRTDLILSGLFQIGVHCKPLETRRLSELFYNFYNPDTALREPLTNDAIDAIGSLYVKKADGEPKGGMYV